VGDDPILLVRGYAMLGKLKKKSGGTLKAIVAVERY
jgi:hypothetical protein